MAPLGALRGAAIVRQRPGAAEGILLVTLEDETLADAEPRLPVARMGYHRAMKRPSGDTEALERRLRPIFRGYPSIAAVYLFGSVARGTASDGSDLDLGLLLDPSGPEGELHRFLGDLAATLESATAPRPLDLVVLNAQGPVFCHEVLLEGRLVYEGDRERRIDFESDTIVRALDFRPTLELATRDYIPAFRRWLRSYRERERHLAATGSSISTTGSTRRSSIAS